MVVEVKLALDENYECFDYTSYTDKFSNSKISIDKIYSSQWLKMAIFNYYSP